MTFDEWWAELRKLADADPDFDCVGPDQESYRDVFADGWSPQDAYDEVWEDCRR